MKIIIRICLLLISIIFQTINVQAQVVDSFFYGREHQFNHIQSFKGELFLSGVISDDYLHAAVYKWNGNALCLVGRSASYGHNFTYVIINAMAVYHDELYVAGNFDDINGTLCKNIARYDGKSWKPVGEGIRYEGIDTFGERGINSLAVYDDKLFAFGEFDSAGNSKILNVAAWDGTKWTGDGLVFSHPFRIGQVIVFKDELFLAFRYGRFTANCGILKWNKTNWDTFKIPYNASFDLMSVYKNRLKIDAFLNDSLKELILDWDGSTWGNPIKTPEGFIFINDIKSSNTRLYILGYGVMVYDDVKNVWDVAVDTSTSRNYLFIDLPGFVFNDNLYFLMNNNFSLGHLKYSNSYVTAPSFTVTPNPASNEINVQILNPSKDMVYILSNTAGQIITQGKLPDDVCCKTLDIHDYSSGVYFLKIKQGKTWAVKKLVFLKE